MRIAKVVLGVVLCAGSLSAQTAPHSAAGRSGVPFPGNALAPSLRAALASNSVFLRLHDLPGIATASTLEVAIDRDGELLAREQFQLGKVKSGDVEVLARQPELLAEVHRAAEKAGERVRLSVRLDGVEVNKLSFREAVAVSRRLKQNGLAPVILTSRLTDGWRLDAAPRAAVGKLPRALFKNEPDPACVDECYNQYGYCSSVEQVGCDCYPNCIDNCINNCPFSCSDPLSVSDETIVTIEGYSQIEYTCYEDYFEWDFVDGHFYRTYQLTLKHWNIRTTLHCDGSQTRELISFFYSTDYCASQDQNNTCGPPWSQSPNQRPWAHSCG
jgi:hypothetical protein